jgi:hypothetical protein
MTEQPGPTPGLTGRLALEGLVIVASILLAFSLDTWWDARPGLLAEGTEEEEKVLQYVMNHLGPGLRTRMDVSRALTISAAPLLERKLSPEESGRVGSLSVDTEVAGVLAARLRLVKHAIEDLEPAREEIDHIVALVEASLESRPQSFPRSRQ